LAAALIRLDASATEGQLLIPTGQLLSCRGP
jgi:hypothetical protein